MAGERVARRVRVAGRVQGVSFRAWTEREAVRLGIAGWVRNEADGSVSAHLEGEAEAVQAMLEALHCGPRLAQVDVVEAREVPPEAIAGFRTQY